MALIDDFKTKFPQFSTTDVDTYFASISAEYPCYYNKVYGANDCNDQAVLFLLAHLLNSTIKSATSSASTGIVSSTSVDGVSDSFDTSAMSGSLSNAFWFSSVYGQKFKMLIQFNRGVKFL
jgi:hypothetical protein